MKIPLKTIIRIIGVTATGAAAILGAIEADDKVQTVVKKVASKSLETMGKES